MLYSVYECDNCTKTVKTDERKRHFWLTLYEQHESKKDQDGRDFCSWECARDYAQKQIDAQKPQEIVVTDSAMTTELANEIASKQLQEFSGGE